MSDIIRKLSRDSEREAAATQRLMNRTIRAVREQSFAPVGGYRPSPVSPVSSVNIPAGVTVSVIAPRFP
jgi:uncharacterized membrane protein YdjX (TVP38/TMEM64 family)